MGQRSLADSSRRRRNSFQSLTTPCWGSTSIRQRPVRNSSLSYHTDILQTAGAINLAVGATELHLSLGDSASTNFHQMYRAGGLVQHVQDDRAVYTIQCSERAMHSRVFGDLRVVVSL